ncbi:MAG: diaminopimelate dehydrogenase [Microthrixaceae bacterium]
MTSDSDSERSRAGRIRVGIVGYGNLGRGVEHSISQNDDMELAGIFTRRDPESVVPVGEGVPVKRLDEVESFMGSIDVMVLCGGSKSDLPEQGPQLVRLFNTVDSFDTHAAIPDYFDSVDGPARAAGHIGLISVGWDPGMFSLQRLLGEALLPEGSTYTFWGKGLSQGHSDALRRVPGVADAVQYTLPSEAAIGRARSGDRPELATREMHTRECYVVLEAGVDADAVENEIVTMPYYFADYDTKVHFISAEDLARDHVGMPHGGFVIRSGATGDGADQTVEFNLDLDSNPGFTASVLVAYARAVHRLSARGEVGARTLFDIAPGLLSRRTPGELRAGLL